MYIVYIEKDMHTNQTQIFKCKCACWIIPPQLHKHSLAQKTTCHGTVDYKCIA